MPIVIFDLPLCIFYFCYYSNCSFLTDTNNTKHIDNIETAKSCCYTFQALIVLVLYVKLQNTITCNVAHAILAQLRYIMTNLLQYLSISFYAYPFKTYLYFKWISFTIALCKLYLLIAFTFSNEGDSDT